MKRNLEITLEQARSLYKSNPELEEMILNSFTIEELESKEIKSWEDLKNISGYCINGHSQILETDKNCASKVNENIFKTEEQALSSLAKAKLSQLLAEYNGDWKPDFTDRTCKKNVIVKRENEITLEELYITHTFLVFRTKQKAEKFLELHRELIEQYYGDI